ncbi:MAG: hypothetical protein WA705_17370 [Candidatus Ozemobacteraceae bacterium]
MHKSTGRSWRNSGGFAFAEAMVMIMMVGSLMMPIMGTLSYSARRTSDLKHRHLAEMQVQAVYSQLLASAPYQPSPTPFSVPDVSLDETSTLTTTITFTEVEEIKNLGNTVALLFNPETYWFRINVQRVSTDPMLEPIASMAFLTGVLACKSQKSVEDPIFIYDNVNARVGVATLTETGGVPSIQILRYFPIASGANCALGGPIALHNAGSLAVHPSGKWLFGAGGKFVWIMDIEPTSLSYGKEIWHYNDATAAFTAGTDIANLLGGNGVVGSYMDISPDGKYFTVSVTGGSYHHFQFDASNPSAPVHLGKNNGDTSTIWHNYDGSNISISENHGFAFSPTGIMGVSQDGTSAGPHVQTADARFALAPPFPGTSDMTRWQPIFVKTADGHQHDGNIQFSPDGTDLFRTTCEGHGPGFVMFDTRLRHSVGQSTGKPGSDNTRTRLCISHDGKYVLESRDEIGDPNFVFYRTDEAPNFTPYEIDNAVANNKNSGMPCVSPDGRYYCLLKPYETANNDTVLLINIASLTSGVAPYNTSNPSTPVIPLTALGNCNPSGIGARRPERLLVGCSDGNTNKIMTCDMGRNKVIREVTVAKKPGLITADPSGCHSFHADLNSASPWPVTHFDGICASQAVFNSPQALRALSIFTSNALLLTSPWTVAKIPWKGGVYSMPVIDLGVSDSPTDYAAYSQSVPRPIRSGEFFTVVDVMANAPGARPGGLLYFDGTEVNRFFYQPNFYDFPASLPYRILISPDDCILACHVPGSPIQRIDLYDITGTISSFSVGARRLNFESNETLAPFYRNSPLCATHNGIPVSQTDSLPIKYPATITHAGCPNAECLNTWWLADHAGLTGVPPIGCLTAHWFGKLIKVPAGAQSYYFGCSANDGSSLGINETTVVDNWAGYPHSMRSDSGSISMSQGAHRFSIEYNDRQVPPHGSPNGNGLFWCEYLEPPNTNFNTNTRASVFIPTNTGSLKFSHGYNPPRFIRSIPLDYGGGIVLQNAGGGGPASGSLIMRMSPTGESIVTLDRFKNRLAEWNVYNTGSWSIPLPAALNATDVALSPDGERIYLAAGAPANQIITVENSHIAPTANNRKSIATISLSIEPISLAQGENRDRVAHGRHWVVTAPAGFPARTTFTTQMYNGKFYFFCGINSAGTAVNSVNTYDPVTNTYGTIAGATTASRGRPRSCVFDEKIFIIGGNNGGASAYAWDDNGVSTVQIFDPQTGLLSAGPSLDTPRGAPGVTTDGDAIYAFAGMNGSGVAQNTLSMYVAGRWVPVPTISPPTARSMPGLVYYKGFLYAFGGRYDSSTIRNNCPRLNLSTLTWDTTTIPVLPATLGDMVAVLVGSRVFLIGGLNDGSNDSDRTYTIDLDLPTAWESLTTIGSDRRAMTGGTFGGRIYFFGGTNISTVMTTDLIQCITP